MNKSEFQKQLLETIGNIENPYHPFVWINGVPKIGEGTYIGGFSEVNAKGADVTIGKYCDIASFVAINAADSHRRCIGLDDFNDVENITLGDKVFVGSHSVILGGVSIGSYSVVAAGTIVRPAKIPPFSLVMGNPMIVKNEYYRREWEEKNGKWSGDDCS